MNEDIKILILFVCIMMPAWVAVVGKSSWSGRVKNILFVAMAFVSLVFAFTVTVIKNLSHDWIFMLAMIGYIGFVFGGIYIYWVRK